MRDYQKLCEQRACERDVWRIEYSLDQLRRAHAFLSDANDLPKATAATRRAIIQAECDLLRAKHRLERTEGT